MLLQYDSAFKPENKIVSEMQVRQDYVDYIYSDQFKNDFERAYNDIPEKRNGLVDILIQLQEAMNQEKKTISWTEESRFTIQMKYSVDALNDLLRKKEQDFASAQDKITKAEERRAFLEDRIPASEQFAKSIVQESLPRVNTKIGEYVLEKQQEIEALNKKIQELQEEYARIQGALIIFGKRAKLEKLDADIEEVKAKVIPLQTQLDEQKKILSMRQDGKEDDEILAWMKQVSVYIKKVQDEVRLCSNAKEEYSRFFNELSESDDNIKAAYEGYHRVEAEQYSEEIKKTIQYLYEQLEKYSLVNIYQQIYDESVQVFKEKNGVKSITGKCHRYDLYVQLMFAMKYFNKKIGNMQFICVDEGQDLAVNEYRLLSELNQNHVVFNIFGDTNQLMKSGRGISDWNLLLSELQAEQYVLNENYRNTNQITRFCNDNFGLKTLQTGVDGPKVREISRRDLEKELAGLMITTERIAILLPRTVQKMKYLDMDILPENIRNMIGETMDNGFICTLLSTYQKGGTVSCKKKDVLNLTLDEYQKYADDLTNGFVEAEKILQEERIFSSKDLPYSTQFIPLAVLCTILSKNNQIKTTTIKNKIKQWYWCGVFGEMYGSANETRYVLDVVGVMDWISDDTKVPKTVQDSYFNPTRLLSLQSRLSAAYKGIMALILKNHCQDFISGREMDFSVYKAENIDIHHIFPKDYCEKQKYDKAKWNSVINKTPITYSTNREIGGVAPSVYLTKIENKGQVSSDILDTYLTTHWIDVVSCRNDNFQEHIIKRAKMLLNAIEKATGKSISGRDSEDVVNAFGGKLS